MEKCLNILSMCMLSKEKVGKGCTKDVHHIAVHVETPQIIMKSVKMPRPLLEWENDAQSMGKWNVKNTQMVKD